ncbi:hypothetical protein [Synechococcus sp. W4D4]|uniref:hypothetical protein n=1 Tax=Synechococcus sp. W4D4 TaxID=3392294 RepID=UPI0039E8A3EB
MTRKQLSMVLPPELLEQIKARANSLGISTTAYITRLVRRDLGLEVMGDVESRLEELENRLKALEPPRRDA